MAYTVPKLKDFSPAALDKAVEKLLVALHEESAALTDALLVAKGAAAPDVATPDAFKKALVEARSVAYTDPAEGGTSGIYFAGVAERFGIGDALKKKALLTKGGREAAIEVAEGRAEMAIVFISEAMALKGVKLAGMLPPPLQEYSAYAAAIPASSTDAAAARAFIAALTSAAMAERWRANGFEPPGR